MLALLALVVYLLGQSEFPAFSGGSAAERAIHRALIEFIVTSMATMAVVTIIATVCPRGRLARFVSDETRKLSFHALWAFVGIAAMLVLFLLNQP